MNNEINEQEYKIQGYWGGEPIWRQRTAEEKAQRAGIKIDVANLYVALDQYPDSFISEQEAEINEDLKN